MEPFKCLRGRRERRLHQPRVTDTDLQPIQKYFLTKVSFEAFSGVFKTLPSVFKCDRELERTTAVGKYSLGKDPGLVHKGRRCFLM